MSDEISILFGRPSTGTSGEDRFDIEVAAAEELDLESYAIPLEPVVNGDAERAVRRLFFSESGLARRSSPPTSPASRTVASQSSR